MLLHFHLGPSRPPAPRLSATASALRSAGRSAAADDEGGGDSASPPRRGAGRHEAGNEKLRSTSIDTHCHVTVLHSNNMSGLSRGCRAPCLPMTKGRAMQENRGVLSWATENSATYCLRYILHVVARRHAVSGVTSAPRSVPSSRGHRHEVEDLTRNSKYFREMTPFPSRYDWTGSVF